MDNLEFLSVLKDSFYEYIAFGARSNKKLVALHGAIARDLSERLGDEYKVYSLGFLEGKEKKIQGRYHEKAVDITIDKGGERIAGFAIKFVMSNYAQNSVNYFENMMGETANIRSAGKKYFQIVILSNIAPYFAVDKNSKEKYISKIEKLTSHNLEKYISLSHDNEREFMHTPDKTFISIVKRPQNFEKDDLFSVFIEKQLANQNWVYEFSQIEGASFGGTNVVLNDYERFIEDCISTIRE